MEKLESGLITVMLIIGFMVLFLPKSSSISILTLNKASLLEDRNEDVWGTWGEWKPCSRSCGGGVTHMQRQCLNPRSDGSCHGPDRMYSSCNIQDCPDGSIDFREEQCSAFNNQSYNDQYYSWKPYFGSASLNPCELYCQAKNASFFNKLSDRVIDGTRCRPDSYDLCIEGVCQEVGCDMMLGSELKLDKCGECGGNGSSCYRVSGVFRPVHIPTGYSEMISIPAGATNINIIEHRSSRNFFAIKDKFGRYHLNGDRRVQSSRALQVAGTKFRYQRKNDRKRTPERLQAVGPTTETIFIDLLVQERNKGVRYNFYLPVGINDPNQESLRWITTRWGRCSRDCDGGLQFRRLHCFKAGKKVASLACRSLKRPKRRRRCNFRPCRASWRAFNWTDCSASCGGGMKFRLVYCVETTTSEKRIPTVLSDDRCLADDTPVKPSSQESCNQFPCSVWQIGNWSRCSTTCGAGFQRRSVACRVGSDCLTLSAPPSQQTCSNGPCTRVSWLMTSWSECTESCGEGMQTRLVRCADDRGALLNDQLCRAISRPESNRTCHSTSGCSEATQWVAGEWSKCSATCSVGVQTRKVVCSILNYAGHKMLPDEECRLVETKPAFMRQCSNPSCEAIWFEGSWTQCSRSCGGGKRNRLITCSADIALHPIPESSCDESRKPPQEEICNSHQCTESDTPPTLMTNINAPTYASCDLTQYGCCPDRITPAQGWLMEGCDEQLIKKSTSKDCRESEHGCCVDGVDSAVGPNHLGCTEYDICYVAKERGRFCGGWLPRWHYDPITSSCEHFWYGGCDGNRNNYNNQSECEAACLKTPFTETTSSVSAPRTTTSTASSSYLDASLRDETDTAVTTLTPFTTQTVILPAVADEASTVWFGSRPPIMSFTKCSLPPKKGPCFGRMHRWYYDPLDHSCKSFVFGGCAGNVNNFKTKKLCTSSCVVKDDRPADEQNHKESTKCEFDQVFSEFEEKRIPQCDPRNGKYLSLQCISDINGDTLSCWCVDQDSGQELDGSRRYGSVAPDCDSLSSSPTSDNHNNPCSTTRFGCCPDGVTTRRTSGRRDCSEKVVIKPGRSLVYARRGGSARLSCASTGYPRPSVRWFKDGQLVQAAETEILMSANEHSLIFTSVWDRHVGSYVCEVGNGVSDLQRRTVRLAFYDKRLRFRTKPHNITSNLGSNPQLKCRARGNRATVQWRKNDLPLQKNSRFTIKPWGDLRISDVQISDSGIYSCVITDRSTSQFLTASAHINVVSQANQAKSTSAITQSSTQSTTSLGTSEKCKDFPDLANCPLVATAGMCSKQQYYRLCCATCRRHNKNRNTTDNRPLS